MEKNNYGASEPISLSVIGAKIAALVGKKALAAGGKALLKGGGKAVLKGGGKKLLKKGGEKVVKEGGKKLFKKSAEEIAKKGKQKLIKKAGKEFVKSDKGKQLAKNARKSKVEGKLKQRAEDYVSGNAQAIDKVKDAYSQGKNKISQGVEKLADKTGKSYDDTMDMVKSKATQAGMAGVNAIQSKKQQETPADVSSFVSSEDVNITQENGEKEVALSGYANPQGPSAYFNKNAGPSMRQGFKYDNTGACLPLQAKSKTTSGDLKTNKPIFSSLDKKNIMVNSGASSSLASLSGSNIKTTKKRNPFEYLKGFDANVNIRGFKVNIGQAAQIAGLLGKGALTAGKKFGDYTKKRKQLKNTKASSTTPKNRPALAASNEKKFSNIAQNNTGGFNYLTKGFKPGGKVSDQDASIFKQNKNK
jgi:hypothetical protein